MKNIIIILYVENVVISVLIVKNLKIIVNLVLIQQGIKLKIVNVKQDSLIMEKMKHVKVYTFIYI